jgi:hypothetical protein
VPVGQDSCAAGHLFLQTSCKLVATTKLVFAACGIEDEQILRLRLQVSQNTLKVSAPLLRARKLNVVVNASDDEAGWKYESIITKG